MKEILRTGGKLNVLIVGSGGREHALAWKLVQSPLVGKIFVAPGNGGMQNESIQIGSTDILGLAEFAKRNRCFTIVGPEVPLSMGIVDRFQERELAIFGPTQEQARLESSKKFAKELMKKKNIPTADFETFENPQKALDYAARYSGNVVLKADGLAAGKGVFVCSSMKEAERAVDSIMVKKDFGKAGDCVVVEQKLHGREISLMTLCNGGEAEPFGTATDHKRLFDDDKGPNTGGMGAYSPSLEFDDGRVEEVMERVIAPVISSMSFFGFLYAGLMVTDYDVKVLEFNARLGDPETQVILPRLDSDLFELILRSYEGQPLKGELGRVKWKSSFSCCVAMCAKGYPTNPRTGDLIVGLDSLSDPSTVVFHAGTKREGEKTVTAGGRVLYVSSSGPTLKEAAEKAYDTVQKISWEGEYHRTDIGKRPAEGGIPKPVEGAMY